jgi:hypothetical protein
MSFHEVFPSLALLFCSINADERPGILIAPYPTLALFPFSFFPLYRELMYDSFAR